MKSLLLPVFVVLSAGFSGDDDETAGTKTAKPFESAFSHATAQFVEDSVSYLASDELGGRFTGSEGEHKATKFIAKIFEEAGLKPTGDIDKKSGDKTYYQNFVFGTRKNSGFKGRNCVGLLEGTDPDLKNEYILVGAHHDHVGNLKDNPRFLGMLERPDKSDGIFNGADDNASGTTTLLTIVHSIGKAGLNFKRSIIFMTFSGEELGLNGSKYYVANPIFPLKQQIAMVNLDMVGGNKGKPLNITGVQSDRTKYLGQVFKECADLVGLQYHLKEEIGTRSDHASFIYQSIPILFFSSGGHDRYHTSRDHYEHLDFDRMANTAKCIVSILWRLGNDELKPVIDLEVVAHMIKMRNKQLGVMAVEVTEDVLEKLGLEEGQGALEITDMQKNSVAEKFGIEAGDYMISFDGNKFPRTGALEKFIKYIKRAEMNTKVPLEIIRNGKKIQIEVIWEAEDEGKKEKREKF
ncbi:MAG: M20/M25/M40 family metallo-hydrolase [Planctomycetes bacterium]|nr:M20/M25/M40 family metallo-hydrolase [Planctomycetota bacterium]